MISVVVAESKAIFRDCLSQCLNNSYDTRAESTSVRCIAAFSEVKQAVDEAINRNANVLVANIYVPGHSICSEVVRAKRVNKRLKVVVYARTAEPEYLLQCRHYGIEGFILTSSSFEDLRNTIIKVHRNQIVYPEPGARLDAKSLQLMGILSLTPRERSVFKFLAEGNSVKEIAMAMGLATKTIEVHKVNLYNKLGLRNRAQLIQYAIRRKIIYLEPVLPVPAIA